MSDTIDMVTQRNPWAVVVTALSFVGAQAVMLWLLLGPVFDQSWLEGFRGYFAIDQLSYAAIATTVGNGTFSPVEPLTETGVSYYPSAWYHVLGLTALVTGVPVYVIWQILGLLAISVAIALLGFLAFRLTRSPIAPLLPGLALATGTLSSLTGNDWFTSLSNHAVIWGPFGTLFTLNAESIGVMAVSVAFTWLVISALRSNTHQRRSVPIIAAAAIFGALANVHTYSFFTGTSLAVAFLACFSLVTRPSTVRLILTLSLTGTVLVLGPSIATITSPLALFGLVLLSTLPASWVLITRHTSLVTTALLTFVLTASPQIIRTTVGFITGDDFLVYRQASTEDLGVDIGPALLSALPLIAIAVTLLAAALARPRTDESASVMAAIAALGAGMIIMASNDLWGFNQEPYRFLLQYSIVGLLTLSTLLPWAWSRRRVISTPSARTVAVLTAAVGVLWATSLTDAAAFRSYARDVGVIAIDAEYGNTLRSLVDSESGLVLSSACQDPQVLRLTTGAPVASFNRGLAWPDKRQELDRLLDLGSKTVLDPSQVATAGITSIITDSGCTEDWSFQDARIQPERIESYSGGTLTLWRVAPSPT